MPLADYQVAWSPKEQVRAKALAALGVGSKQSAALLNDEFHRGAAIRTTAAVTNFRRRYKVKVTKRVKPDAPQTFAPDVEQQVEQKDTHDGREARSYGTRIKTVEDLLRHIEADLTKFEVEKSEATKNEQVMKGPMKKPIVTEYHRVFVRLRPKVGLNAEELVKAVVDGALRTREPIVAKYPLRRSMDVLQGIVVADPHIGKFAWARETGHENYDIGIATKLLRNSVARLLADGNQRGVGRRAFWLLGDYFHYDTPQGQTTGGTALDRDGRVEKMIEEGAAVLCDLIEASAKDCPTDVVLVPGNHDAVLTVALRQILTAYFRNDGRVTVDTRGTTRKYVQWGKCLIGLTHGDKAKKRLGELMSAEAAGPWGQSTYREIHTGHLHSVAEVQSVAGVVIRTAPALCPPDGWHAQEGFVGMVRGTESFFYHHNGALVGMTMANPDADTR